MKEPARKGLTRFFSILGPGIITGAADDDPSGIATYSMAGATLGTAMLWTALITWPLMATVQMMCARKVVYIHKKDGVGFETFERADCGESNVFAVGHGFVRLLFQQRVVDVEKAVAEGAVLIPVPGEDDNVIRLHASAQHAVDGFAHIAPLFRRVLVPFMFDVRAARLKCFITPDCGDNLSGYCDGFSISAIDGEPELRGIGLADCFEPLSGVGFENILVLIEKDAPPPGCDAAFQKGIENVEVILAEQILAFIHYENVKMRKLVAVKEHFEAEFGIKDCVEIVFFRRWKFRGKASLFNCGGHEAVEVAGVKVVCSPYGVFDETRKVAIVAAEEDLCAGTGLAQRFLDGEEGLAGSWASFDNGAVVVAERVKDIVLLGGQTKKLLINLANTGAEGRAKIEVSSKFVVNEMDQRWGK